jgi:NitT/TauT family transport system substrate-binding protein
VKVAYVQGGDDFPLWVALDAGILRQNGIDADASAFDGALAVNGLLANQVDLALFGAAQTVSAAAGGADLVMIATLVPTYPYELWAKKEIRTVSDLKGKKIGVSSLGSSSDIATRVALQKQGLDPEKDVTIIAAGSGSTRTAALVSGAIDATVADPSFDAPLRGAGLTRLLSIAGLKLPAANTGVVVQRSWLNAHKDLAQAFVDSMVQAIAYANKNKDFSVGVLKKYLKIDDTPSMENTYSFYLRDVMPAYPTPSVEQFKDVVDILAKGNDKVATLDLAKLIDASFVKSARDRGLGG